MWDFAGLNERLRYHGTMRDGLALETKAVWIAQPLHLCPFWIISVQLLVNHTSAEVKDIICGFESSARIKMIVCKKGV
jgi:hypothetical protein